MTVTESIREFLSVNAEFLHALVTGDAPVLTYALVAVPVLALVYALVTGDHGVTPADVAGTPPLDAVAQRRDVLHVIRDPRNVHRDDSADIGVIFPENRPNGYVPTYREYAHGETCAYSDISGIDEFGRETSALTRSYSSAPMTFAGALRHIATPHQGVVMVEIPRTVHGDYVGNAYNAVNARVLLDRYPSTFVVSSDRYGARSLWLPLVGPLVPASLVDDVAGIYDVPVLDEDALDEYTSEGVVTALDSWLEDDVMRGAVSEFIDDAPAEFVEMLDTYARRTVRELAADYTDGHEGVDVAFMLDELTDAVVESLQEYARELFAANGIRS